jgi:hypothetical protein
MAEKPKLESVKISPDALSGLYEIGLCDPIKEKINRIEVCGPNIEIKQCAPLEKLKCIPDTTTLQTIKSPWPGDCGPCIPSWTCIPSTICTPCIPSKIIFAERDYGKIPCGQCGVCSEPPWGGHRWEDYRENWEIYRSIMVDNQLLKAQNIALEKRIAELEAKIAPR